MPLYISSHEMCFGMVMTYRKFSQISDTFYLLRFSLADGGRNFPKKTIKAQTLWPKFAEIINWNES